MSTALLVPSNSSDFCNSHSRFSLRSLSPCEGISRSSTITLAYMMTWLEMDFETAYKELALARVPPSPHYRHAASPALLLHAPCVPHRTV
jgi:hypothetical protein